MSMIETRASQSIKIAGPQDLLKAITKWLYRRRKHAEIAALLGKEDWILQDMGITRGDVREALAFRGDAALHLRALAARRRFWSHSCH